MKRKIKNTLIGAMALASFGLSGCGSGNTNSFPGNCKTLNNQQTNNKLPDFICAGLDSNGLADTLSRGIKYRIQVDTINIDRLTLGFLNDPNHGAWLVFNKKIDPNSMKNYLEFSVPTYLSPGNSIYFNLIAYGQKSTVQDETLRRFILQ